MRPTPFYVQVTLALPGGEEVIDGLPVQHRYEGNIFSGEKRTELLVVPAFSVRVSPQVAIVPARPFASRYARPAVPTAPAAGRGTAAPPPPSSDAVRAPSATREIRVTVVNDTQGPAETRREASWLPQGWTVDAAASSR